MKTDSKPMDVLRRLVNKATTWRFIRCDSRPNRPYKEGEVGQFVLNASEQERKLLQQLTSADAANVRSDIDVIKYNSSPTPTLGEQVERLRKR